MLKWHTMSVDEIEKNLKTSKIKGLNKSEASRRLKKNGYNKLKKQKNKNILIRIIEQFKDFMVLILLVSAIISFFLGETTDALIILIIITTNAIIGLVQEGKAQKSIEALQKLSTSKSKVIRDGKIDVISAENLVVGDVVIIEAGDSIPADLRIFESVNLTVQESSFTGETTPVHKSTNTLIEDNLSIADRTNIAFSSSLVTYGRGKGIVINTGMNTEIGKIAKYVQTEGIQDTPLKKKLEALGKLLGIVALVICFIIFLMGLVIYKMDVFEIFLVAISLAVAAIPEGLPAVATIVLALGVQKMAKKKAIIRKLPSVETLGSTTVICSDKTGTLTQNKMTVKKVFIDSYIENFDKNVRVTENVKLLVNISNLCNDSKLKQSFMSQEIIGDPTEVALVEMSKVIKSSKKELDEKYPRISEIPFNSTRKCMTTIHKVNNEYLAYVKGGLDEILDKCCYIKQHNNVVKLESIHINKIKRANENLTKEALRVLAMAYRKVDSVNVNNSEIESNLIFVGLVGMIDPPRPEVKNAIKKCKDAGIKTIMITGDHKITASTIAKELGILTGSTQVITGKEMDSLSDDMFAQKVNNYSVYARVSPEHKVKIVKALKKNNEIVAMTGDGINDAPALKSADIGIAMGNVGTEVAKEASDMILANDNFATIALAVEEGRRILDNITKSIKFLLSCNAGEIFTIFFAMLFGISKPFLPIHILWINLVTDCFPALALGVDKPEENIMKRKPNKTNTSLLTPKMLFVILYQGITIAAATLIAFFIGLHTNVATAQTMAFAVLGFSQLTHAFNIHINHKSIFSTKTFANKYLIFATILSAMFMFMVLWIPTLRDLFKFAILSSQNAIYVTILSFVPIIIVEMLKKFKIE